MHTPKTAKETQTLLLRCAFRSRRSDVVNFKTMTTRKLKQNKGHNTYLTITVPTDIARESFRRAKRQLQSKSGYFTNLAKLALESDEREFLHEINTGKKSKRRAIA